MSEERIPPDQVKRLNGFSVGILNGRETMMVIDYADSIGDYAVSTQHRRFITMSSDQARQLAQGLLKAANFPETTPPSRELPSKD